MRNNWYNKLFHGKALKEQLFEEDQETANALFEQERRNTEKANAAKEAFERLHNANPDPTITRVGRNKKVKKDKVKPAQSQQYIPEEDTFRRKDTAYVPVPSMSFDTPSTFTVDTPAPEPEFVGGGGSFGGAGASASWDEPAREPSPSSSYESSSDSSSSDSSSSPDSGSSDSGSSSSGD